MVADDGPPPLEKLRQHSPTECKKTAGDVGRRSDARSESHGLRKGFFSEKCRSNLVNQDKKPIKNIITHPISEIHRSERFPEDIRSCIREIVTDHYKSDGFLQGSLVEGRGSSTFEPLEDFLRLMEILREDPSRLDGVFTANPYAAVSFKRLMGKLGDFFESKASEKEGNNETDARLARFQASLNDPRIRRIVQLIKEGAKIDPREVETRNPQLGHMLRELLNAGYLRLN
jgi:hypothetical protein